MKQLYILLLIACLCVGVITTFPTTAHAQESSVTVWIQVTDSCNQALSGATFTVAGPGIAEDETAPTTGTVPRKVPTYIGQCPVQQGTCINFSTGCTMAILDIPTSGVNVYSITVAKTAPGHGTNLSYAICTGGSDCRHGPEIATVLVSADGTMSATTRNVYPDGVSVTWPTNKAAYSGTQDDPVLFHEFGIGDGSIQCDGDHDADDYLTGKPSRHCDGK